MKTLQKGHIVWVILVLYSSALVAQVTDFKLSDYKYRTPLYQSLQMDLDLTQSGTTGGESKGVSASLEAFLAYLKVFATDKRQHISIASAFTQPRFGNSKLGDVTNINNGFSAGARYSTQDRRYKENYFIETGGSVGGNTFGTKSGQKGQAVSQNDRHATLELNAGIGKGRLEYVHDAQAALLMLQDLYESGIIKTKVDAETAYRFAQLITNIKKQRVLDSRRRNIFKLTQVDSFLRVNKLVTQCDARTMAIVNDILFYSFQNDLSGNMNTFEDPVDFSWTRGNYDEGFERTDYGLIPQIESYSDQAFRQHGTVMYARLIPGLRYNSFNTKTERPTIGDTVTKSSYVHVEPGIELGYEKHRAIDLKWQKNIRVAVRFIYTNYLVSKPNENVNFPLTQFDADYEIGYYPNSRSVIEGSAGLSVNHFGGGTKSTFITPGIALSAGYFISYNTVLRATFNAQYAVQTGVVDEKRFNQGLRFYLRHYFF